MQAIETRYIGPTNHRGARIKATTASGISRTVPHDHAESTESAHWTAAYALAAHLGWDGEYVAGSTRDGYVFVRIQYDDGLAANLRRVHPAACA